MSQVNCSICGTAILMVGSYVKQGRGHAHVQCFTRPLEDAAYQRGRQSFADEFKARQEEIQREADAKRAVAEEAARVKKLAEENARLEKERINNLVKQERDKLLAADKAVTDPDFASKGRFGLIELATPEEEAALAAQRKAEADALTARQAADADALKHCVRCKVLLDPISQEHPRHCYKCWMDNSTGQNGKLADVSKVEDQIKEAVKQGIRPLELE